MLTCESCAFMCASQAEMDSHTQSRFHLNKVRGTSQLLRCPLCPDRLIWGPRIWAIHTGSVKHGKRSRAAGVDPLAVVPEKHDDVPRHTFCVTCSTHIPDAHWNSHIKNTRHLQKEQFAAFKVVLEEAEKDKHGVVVTGDFDFGIVEPVAAAKGTSLGGSIMTTNPTSHITLVDFKLGSARGPNLRSSSFQISISGDRRTLSASLPITFQIMLCQDYVGRCQERAELAFQDTQLGTHFTIVRALEGIIGNKVDHERLQPVAPYVPRPRTARQLELEIVEGVRPPSSKVIPYVMPLPRASIPKDLVTTLSTGSSEAKIARIRSVFLPSKFKLIALGIPDTSSTFYGSRSFRWSDRILVQAKGAQEGHWFEGGVHDVLQAEVNLRFSKSFKASTLYNARFKLNRIPVRRQHQALDSAFSEDRMLFPERKHLPRGAYPKQADARIVPVNGLIGSNPPQLQAVVSIVKQPPGSLPFIVFGPPGTGKTVTIVEAIKQVLMAKPNAHILAIAPSNSAADLIAMRLRDLNTSKLFRLYAPSRSKNKVPLELRDYTHTRGSALDLSVVPMFSVPPMARMTRFRVVVTTCVSASIVSGIGIPRGHYSHIFVDEAGQATEPEVFIAIKTMAGPETNVVLSGDPKQLGPIIRSRIACELGLETSYIERLMSREAYDLTEGYGRSVVRLVKDFRSHSAILKFPNERFYGSELEQCGDAKVINSFLGSQYLPNAKFPIVFHGLCGKDDREASSPSFFNADEALQVKQYVQDLRADPRFRTIAVTRAQALLIVIGDPTVLSLDPLWRSFLNYIHRNNGWTGSPITWDPTAPVNEEGGYDREIREAAQMDMNNFTRQMEALTLAGVEATGENENHGNVDRPWRDVE
ncbi:hypothetical protein DXG01_014452 [Tephrocybe rancida]|nr:hypothetical protein DXG01_014452 [Tephrocybe rancida]